MSAALFSFGAVGSVLAQGRGGVVSGLAVVEVVAGQNGVQHDAGDGGDGQRGEGDGGAAHLEGQAAGEAQAAHQNDGGDDPT